jgi:hypothetical protein
VRAIVRAFDQISEDFVIDLERATIARLKRAAAAPAAARPAQTAFARGEEGPPLPHPANAARAATELSLRRTLERFQQEEREWDRLSAAAAAGPPAAPAVPPLAAGAGVSSHPLFHALSAEDRALLGEGEGGAGGPLPDLLAWARGLVEAGLGPARARVAGVEAAAAAAEAAHRRLVGGLRRRAFAPLGAGDPRRILRAVM